MPRDRELSNAEVEDERRELVTEPRAVAVMILIWVPCVIAPAAVVLTRCEVCEVEAMAAMACHLALVPVVYFPFFVLLGFMVARPLVPRAIAELCVMWILWNSHLVGFGLMLIPFTYGSTSYLGALYDYVVFCCFVLMPLVIYSGGLKLVATKRGWVWGWRHRASLGTGCLLITFSMWAGQAYVRPHAMGTTIGMTLAFYVYTAVTMLPPLPNAAAPELSGSRDWPAFVSFWQPVWDLAISYLKIKVVDDGGGGGGSSRPPFELDRPTLVGFHPHGIIPYTGGLMQLTAEWRERHRVRPHMMTDFFTHLVPLMRDLVQWLGAREVSREAIAHLLDTRQACLLVPGGQAEIFTTRSWGKEVFLYRAHKGFIKLALRHRARLVPVLSMGEWELMDNVSMPTVQGFSRRFIGFPFPFIPYGAYWLPMPRRPKHGLTVIVGQPIDVLCDGEPTAEEVDRVHKAYFDALAGMFERHKAACGYPEHKLVMLDGHQKQRPKSKAA